MSRRRRNKGSGFWKLILLIILFSALDNIGIGGILGFLVQFALFVGLGAAAIAALVIFLVKNDKREQIEEKIRTKVEEKTGRPVYHKPERPNPNQKRASTIIDAEVVGQRAQETVPPQPQPQPKAESVYRTGNSELDAIVQEGRKSVERIRELNNEIPDFKLSAQLKQIEILTSAIIDQVEKNEDKQKQTRQFMNYYLPTTIRLLEQYVQLQNVGLKGENIGAAMQQIEELLDKVIVAFQKQLDSLFEKDVIDITADIQVMEQMMASQGLTEEAAFTNL